MRLFISYDPGERVACERIASALRTSHEVWYDPHPESGTTEWGQVQQWLEWCEGFVYLLSPESMASERCRWEYTIARESGRLIFLITLHSGIPIPIEMSETLLADLGEGITPEALSRLAAGIRSTEEKLGGGGRKPPGPRWRTGVIIGVAGVVAVALIAAVLLPGGRLADIIAHPDPPGETALSEPPPTVAMPTVTPMPRVPSVPGAVSEPDVKEQPEPIEEGPLPETVEAVVQNADWLERKRIEEINGVQMALVPPGCLPMGSEDGEGDELPVHRVCFDRPFWIDVYEVTNAQFEAFDGVAEHPPAHRGPNQPRDRITWGEAAAFCAQRGARLPTEAEWEYAARGPDGLAYPWGEEFDGALVVWNTAQSSDVGSRPEGASWVGAMDMAGNLREWVSTIYRPYPYDPADGREQFDSTEPRGLRGGSWYDVNFELLRAADRYRDFPVVENNVIGFRCAADYEG
ncbi:MAG: hypothetical protein Kow00124_11080 [Anaerolineae bacterium]